MLLIDIFGRLFRAYPTYARYKFKNGHTLKKRTVTVLTKIVNPLVTNRIRVE